MLPSSRKFILTLSLILSVSAVYISADIICPDDPGPGQYLFPHQNCSLFYVCEEGNLTVLECPPDLYFNPVLKVCDFPQNVPECSGGTRPTTTSTASPTDIPIETSPEPEETSVAVTTTTTTTTTPAPTEPESTREEAPTTDSYNPTTDGIGEWIVIQRRGAALESGDIRQNFNKGMADYVAGFGDSNKDFWLGLDKIAALTQSGTYELLVEMREFNGSWRWANYDVFRLDANDAYRLFVSGFSGNTVDALTEIHNGRVFITSEQGGCGSYHSAGWWYNNCFTSNLNGIYYDTTTGTCGAIRWESPPDACQGNYYNLAFVEMKIRRW